MDTWPSGLTFGAAATAGTAKTVASRGPNLGFCLKITCGGCNNAFRLGQIRPIITMGCFTQ
jgi:hypothetical protein